MAAATVYSTDTRQSTRPSLDARPPNAILAQSRDSIEACPPSTRGELQETFFEHGVHADLFVAPNRQLYLANGRARRLLRFGRPIELAKGIVEGDTRQNASVLARAIAEAGPRPRIYALQTESDLRPMAVRLLPGEPRSIALSLRTSVAPALHRLAPIAEQFRLTARETQFLRLMAGGLNVHEASLAMRVATSTGRVYIKQIYSKIGLRSRAQLISLVLQFCAIGS